MKKTLPLLLLCTGILLTGFPTQAKTSLQEVLPLLQKNNRSQTENYQVLQLFRTSNQPDIVFSAGASLVKTLPAKNQLPALYSLLMRTDNPLKQIFSAVIITAMGDSSAELRPPLQQALAGQEPLLRAYAAGAYALLEPQNTSYTEDLVRLYIFDADFAQRAMNKLLGPKQSPFKYLKAASSSTDEQTRAAAASWLGKLHTPQTAKQLLAMAKADNPSTVQAAVAAGLAAQREQTLPDVLKGLRKNHQSSYANTCALALGFMTGNAVESLRQNLIGKNIQARINAARAAAYMANVLANPDAFAYSSDRSFDIHLLKGLIAPLSALANQGSETEKIYAANALRQIEKLME
ncbi:MAG: HEAT repeat domain-containing protein [Elusimicrobiaceae bacterium]|nr:HEAT repeat domain-containing protein [Elusimicrobiaceae bacterium]